MKEFFAGTGKIKYEGPDSKNPLAFKHYNPKSKILGKRMDEHLRFAVCYWHTFRGTGADPFGPASFIRDWWKGSDEMDAAENTLRAAFEFLDKLGVGFWTFHDRDIAPESSSLAETNKRLDKIVTLAKKLQADTGIRCLWGTANMFSNRRYIAGAATNPDPKIFAYAAAQVKKAMEATKRLGGEGYVFWGGREGYETLLNTDMKRELDHLAAFLRMAADYKKKLRFKGQLYIEPKPKEPTKHQYDFDAAAVYAFLLKNKLAGEFKLNIEANHATLAGHSFIHELTYAVENGLLGSVDANRGDLLLGWDTDQFPTNLYDTTLAMYVILKHGGFTTGGLNFDAKLRRQSIDPVDLFHAHIGAMDTFARGLKIAAMLLRSKKIETLVRKRYSGWDRNMGRKIESGVADFASLEKYALNNPEPRPASGKQEMFENILNDFIE